MYKNHFKKNKKFNTIDIANYCPINLTNNINKIYQIINNALNHYMKHKIIPDN